MELDGQKFDKLARAFATGTDRRTLLKIFGGATVAGVAGMTVARPLGVFAQGDVQPGGECTTDDDCAQGSCYVEAEGEPGVCYCEDWARPWVGCACNAGVEGVCDGRPELCCTANADDEVGTAGTCISPMASCEYPVDPTCSEPGTSCEETDCCTVGTCGANGWCTACYSGTEDPCGALNEAFGADFICCTAAGAAEGAVGYCVEADLCVSDTPNTGAGTTADTSSWIAPAAAVGAAAAVIAYKSRDRKGEIEA